LIISCICSFFSDSTPINAGPRSLFGFLTK